MTTRFAAAGLALGLGLASATTPASAVTLNEGDILVTDRTNKAVLRIDPVSGVQTEISSGGLLVVPETVAIEANGNILVTDRVVDAVTRIEPATGGQNTLSSGGSFGFLGGVAIDADGQILVAEHPFGIISIDPVTGAQRTVVYGSFGGSLGQLGGIAIEANGDFVVADQTVQGVTRIDPDTGTQTTVSSGGFFFFPSAIAVEADGGLLVTDFNRAAVIRVDPETGAQSIVSSEGLLDTPIGIAVEASGAILVADTGADAVIRIDPVSGAQSIVSSGGLLATPYGIAVVPALVPRYACAGFDGGGEVPVTVTEPSTLPARAVLLDDAIPVTDADLAAPPLALVTFSSGQPAEPPTDITDLVPPPDPRFLDNRFVYVGSQQKWVHGLLTLKFAAPGTYTVTMVSGDDQEYVVDPTCTATYVVE